MMMVVVMMMIVLKKVGVVGGVCGSVVARGEIGCKSENRSGNAIANQMRGASGVA